MKKPTSLYLNELQANRVARRLEKALDGHGSLSGFFSWLETRAYATLIEGGEYEDPSSQRAWDDYLKVVDHWQRLGEQEAMSAYRQAWERLAERLPWHQENPAASHVLALFALKDNRGLWDLPRGEEQYLANKNTRVGGVRGAFFAHQGTQAVLEAFRRLAQPPKEQVVSTARLWLSDRLEVLREAPRARPVSFYFEEAAHAVMLRVFKGTLFNRLLGTLDELLAGWEDHARILSPEARFLEHPASFYRYWPLTVPDAVDVDVQKLASTQEDVEWLVELLGVLTENWPDGLMPEEWLLMFSIEEVTWEVLARLAERFGWERVKAATLDALDSLFLLRDEAFRLAFSLDLIDPLYPRAEGVEERTPGAFLVRYGLNELRPERSIMYKVIKRRLPSLQERVQDPLEFHVLRLIQAYALEVLPPEEREPERVAHPVLGILGQTDLFLTRDTLEAWSGMRVRVEGPNRWRLFKGRKLWGELTDEQAYEAATLLRFLRLRQPSKEAPSRVAYPRGVELLERALEVLAKPISLEGEDPKSEWERRIHRIKLLSEELKKHLIPRDA